MKTQNFGIVLIKFTFVNLVRNIVYWPFWWYSAGLVIALKGVGNLIARSWKGLALGVWLKNIFRPMYGQYDFASRIISFVMRLIQIIARLIIMAVLTAVFIGLLAVYLVLPPFSVWMLIRLYFINA